MKIKNLDRLRRRLERIPDAIRKRAKADLMLGGREINMLQRSLAPKDDGVLVGTIRTEQLPDPEIGVEIKAGGPETTKPVRNSEKGNAPEYDYALAQEHGTENMQANPFFYPAYRLKKKQVQRSVRRGVRKALRNAVKGQ
ncbi:HK97-gp10 family putative phage morphogenesis protein [Aquamicrobium sp. LC103]|uniref:HK97-gp10 family putative phage morphogenesis protein n=1 Tax=Aquamicrobium sp. LC103 TaxID=1120658 RepID=UPI00063EB691|nr:HK97-gp10 family putative phage morphogenesis protein [Aquamicrobium sp. LC103]TKT78421.1 hypothetical protein XW59_012460 [Aquamicrobium sp. LC103]